MKEGGKERGGLSSWSKESKQNKNFKCLHPQKVHRLYEKEIAFITSDTQQQKQLNSESIILHVLNLNNDGVGMDARADLCFNSLPHPFSLSELFVCSCACMFCVYTSVLSVCACVFCIYASDLCVRVCACVPMGDSVCEDACFCFSAFVNAVFTRSQVLAVQK